MPRYWGYFDEEKVDAARRSRGPAVRISARPWMMTQRSRRPVLVVLVDHDGDLGILADVAHALEARRRRRLGLASMAETSASPSQA